MRKRVVLKLWLRCYRLGDDGSMAGDDDEELCGCECVSIIVMRERLVVIILSW